MSGGRDVAAERPLGFAFDSPPIVTPQPVFLQPHYAGKDRDLVFTFLTCGWER